MRVSLIITTYNWKEALAVVLASAFRQTLLPMEIVVADDGSRSDTADLVASLGAEAPVPVLHSWQKDKGFRAAKSRNRAIRKARGDYILFVDGDMILDRRFVADHLAVARRGWFVQGPRALLGAALTTEVLATGRLHLPFAARGVGNKKNCLRSVWLSRLLSWQSTTLSGIRLCNFAFWREDAFRVNGFNEEFVGWGREDSEFVARLLNSGLKRRNLRFRALGYHLHHPMNDRGRLSLNDELLQSTIERQLVRCDRGLDQSDL